MVVSLLTKSILTLPLVGLAIFNMIVMLELLGRTERKHNPTSLRKIHRIAGILFIILFFVISYFCINYLIASGRELTSRVALHSVMSVAVLVVLCFKLLFVRVYRKYYSMAVSLGLGVVLLTLTSAAMSAGYHFSTKARLAAFPGASLEEGPAKDGAVIFTKNCSGCHYADKTDTRIGPGLKGLFKRDILPVSGRPVSEANIRKQLKTPFRAMPSFAGLQEEEVKALLEFLQTL